jgi:hypothetical protein
VRAALAFVVVVTALLSASPAAAAADPAAPSAVGADFPIANGWYFSQAGGYSITNDGGVMLWRDYQRLGGVGTLGYPSTWRWVGADGFVYQATQAALLQWNPEQGQTVLANAFDILSNASKDDWLRSQRAIPPPVADDGSRGDSSRSTQLRLGWLEDDAIRASYLANPNPAELRDWSPERAVELYGLPTSHPLRQGPFVVQRFQRITFQRWVEAVPGMPLPGSVTRVLAGDLLKEAGLVPAASAAPAPAGAFEARTDPELRGRLALLADLPAGRPLYDLALQQPIAIVWAPMPPQVGALYSAQRRWLAVNVHWHDADPKGIATLLSHELSHLRDFVANRIAPTRDGCLQTEQTAFRTQASVWEAFYGRGGKPTELTEIDRQNNYILWLSQRDPDAFAARIATAYDQDCAVFRR